MIVEHDYDFSRRLKSIRESRGLTQRELGERINTTANVVSNWEIGSGKPRLDLFRDLCIALNCPPGDLLGLSPSELSNVEYSLLKGFRSVNDAGQHTIIAVLESQIALRESSDG